MIYIQNYHVIVEIVNVVSEIQIFETDKLKVWGGYNCHCNMCIDVDKTHIDSRLGMGMRSIGVPDQGIRFEDELSRDNCIYTRTSAFAQRARSKCYSLYL